MSYDGRSLDELLRDPNFIPAEWLLHQHQHTLGGVPSAPLQSTYDEHMSTIHPNHIPTHQYLLRATLLSMGANEQTIHQFQAAQNERWQAIFDQQPDGRLHVLGEKPGPQDPVEYFKIPDCPFAIRIWSGGMEEFGHYFIDFFHINSHTAVNTPDGFKITSAYTPGTIIFGGDLVSWEVAMGINQVDLMPGTEKFCVPEGARLMLIRPQEEAFHFQIPVRPVWSTGFAKPQAELS